MIIPLILKNNNLPCQEATLLVPADPIFEKTARECVDAGVGVDMFLFPHAYVDVASMGKIATDTGGVIQRFPMFRADVDGERLIQVRYYFILFINVWSVVVH